MENTSVNPRGPVEAAFAKQLLAAMEECRLTPVELAKRVNISAGAVRSYLAGRFLPRPPVLRDLENALEVRFVMNDPSVTKPQKVTSLSGSAKATSTATGNLTDAPPSLSIAQAKQALARTLGVTEAQIEISVRA